MCVCSTMLIEHIVGSDGRAILKSGLGIEKERDRGPISRNVNFLGNQRVQGKGFIPDALHQAVMDEAEALHGHALDAERVKRRERTGA